MRWVRELFSRRGRYDDLTVSIEAHLAEKIEDLIENGMSEEEAERTARREFGNMMLIKGAVARFGNGHALRAFGPI